MAQSIIREANETSQKLEEIHRLLPISKIKPKIVQNTRVAQVCGSMERKKVLNGVGSLKKQKEEKIIVKVAKENKKRKDFLQIQSKVWVADQNVKPLA